MFTDCHSVLASLRNHFSQLSHVNGVSGVRHTEIHATVPLLSETSACEVDLAIEKLQTHKSPDIDQIPTKLIKTGGRTIRSEIHKRINSILNKEEFPVEWEEPIIVPIYKKGDKTDCTKYRRISLLPTTHKILSNILLVRLNSYEEESIGDHQCQLLIIYILHSLKTSEKDGYKMKQCISSL
jgi:hypothetical protein